MIFAGLVLFIILVLKNSRFKSRFKNVRNMKWCNYHVRRGEAFPFHGPGNCGEVGLGGRRSEVLTVVASHHSVWDISDTHCLIVVANYHGPLGPCVPGSTA